MPDFLLDENDPESIVVGADGRLASEDSDVPGLRLIDSGASEFGWSKAELHIRCPRAYAFRYLASEADLGAKRPAPAAPLCRGILVHCGIAHFYEQIRWQQKGRRLDEFGAHYWSPAQAMKIRAKRLIEVDGCNPRDVEGYLALAIAACKAYFGKYGVDDWEIVAVEKLWTATTEELEAATAMKVPLPFTTRIDLIYRYRGKMIVIDHKTTAAGLSAQRYTLSGGISSKTWLAHRRFGADFGGMRINMIAWRGVKETLDENGTVHIPDADKALITCKRFNLDPAPFAVSRWPFDYAEHAQRLVSLRLKTIRNVDGSIKSVDTRSAWEYPGASSEQVCETKYGKCEFWELCRWGPSAKAAGASRTEGSEVEE